MKFEIHPLKGVAALEFGMTPGQVRRSMGSNFVLFKRGGNVEDGDGDHPSDYYTEEGVFFYYSPDGYLEAIEFAPSAARMVAGVNFFEMPMKAAVEVLRRMDPDMTIKSDTAWSDRLGLALWTSEGWYDAERQSWKEEDDGDGDDGDGDDDDGEDDWEPEEPKVGSVLIAPLGGLGYLSA